MNLIISHACIRLVFFLKHEYVCCIRKIETTGQPPVTRIINLNCHIFEETKIPASIENSLRLPYLCYWWRSWLVYFGKKTYTPRRLFRFYKCHGGFPKLSMMKMLKICVFSGCLFCVLYFIL